MSLTRIKNNQPLYLGIDIGVYCIKLLELQPQGQNLLIENFGLTLLPEHTITSTTEIKNQALLGEIVAKLVETFHTENLQVAVSLPGSLAMIKTLTIEKNLKLPEIEAQAWAEAKKMLPEMVDDISLDFKILGPSEDDKSMEVLLVVCRKEHIDARISILNEAGLTAKIMDLDYYAYARTLNYLILQQALDINQTIAFLNLGYTTSTLIVQQNDKLIYSHDQTFHGHYFLQQMLSLLEITDFYAPWPEIPALKKDEMTTLIKDNILPHVRHFLQYFYANNAQSELKTIFIAGECAMIPGVDSAISEMTGAQTYIANPFKKAVLSSAVNGKKLEFLAPSVALCFGLCISETNQ